MLDQILLGAERRFSAHVSVFGQGEGDHPGDKGGGHGGSAEYGVAPGRIAGGDLIARGNHIDLTATGRKLREMFPAIDGAHGHHLGKAGGIAHGIEIGPFVAGGGDDKDAFGDGKEERLVNLLVGFGAAEAHGEDVGPGLHGPANTGDDILGSAGSLVVKDLGRDDFCLGSHPDNSVGVAAGGDDARDVGAVALGVVGGRGAAGEVAGFDDGGREVGMFEGDAGIKHADLDALAFGFFPERRDAEELESPVDGLGRGKHDLIHLEGREAVDGGGHTVV